MGKEFTWLKELQAKIIRYNRPEVTPEKPKAIVSLCKSDIMWAMVQVVTKGGENYLHTHKAEDGFFLVLSGRARFMGEGDVVLGEFGALEGIFMPRGFKYSLESAGEDPLELLRVGATALGEEGGIVNFRPALENTRKKVVLEEAAG